MPKVKPSASALAERSDTIKSLALNLIREETLSGLTMDKVVQRSPYSKGTVYKHYCCKEDLVTALALDGNQRLLQRLHPYHSVTNNTRQAITRLARDYLGFALEEPEYHQLMIYESSGLFRDKSSDQHQHQLTESGNIVLRIICGIIRTAIQLGELKSRETTPEQITFTLWSMGFGTIRLLKNSPEQCCIRDQLCLEHEFIRQYELLLDALNWS